MECFSVNGQSLNVFTSPYIGENMFVMVKNGQALAIDPNDSEDALDFLKKSGVQNVTIFLTHEHPDHTCGVPVLKQNFKTKLVCQQLCAEYIADKSNNRPIILELILRFQDEKYGTNTADTYPYPKHEYVCRTDVDFENVLSYDWQSEHFAFYHTPGHSYGSCCIVWNDKAVFTGDSLLKDMPVITRFPGGSTKQYNAITKPFLDSLPDNITVLPGHGKIFAMKDLQEKTA